MQNFKIGVSVSVTSHDLINDVQDHLEQIVAKTAAKTSVCVAFKSASMTTDGYTYNFCVKCVVDDIDELCLALRTELNLISLTVEVI